MQIWRKNIRACFYVLFSDIFIRFRAMICRLKQFIGTFTYPILSNYIGIAEPKIAIFTFEFYLIGLSYTFL